MRGLRAIGAAVGAGCVLAAGAMADGCVSSSDSPLPDLDGSPGFDASELDAHTFTQIDANGFDATFFVDAPGDAPQGTVDASAPPDDGSVPDAGPPASDSATSGDGATGPVDAGGTVTSSTTLRLGLFRQNHTATLLNDGHVLFCGGYYGPSGSTPTCDVFDPVSNTMIAHPMMNVGRQNHTATVLKNGQVAIIGGTGANLSDGGDFNALKSAEIYDPTAGTFTLVTNAPNQARTGGAAVLLTPAAVSGKVLLLGGDGDGTIDSGTANDPALGSLEIFDPTTTATQGTFTLLPVQMNARRSGLVATSLVDGGVFLTAGYFGPGGGPYTYLSSGQLFDPTTSTFADAGNTMSEGRAGPEWTLLNDGRVFITGGQSSGATTTADIYDPKTNTFSSVTLPAGRAYAAVATLKSGRVLLAGGVVNNQDVGDLVIFDPATNKFTPLTATLSVPRSLASATTMNDGRVLIAGGQGAQGIVDTIDIFTE